MRKPEKHNKYAPTSEDGYKQEVEKHRSIFNEIVGCKITKITIPKDSCGNAEDAYTLHLIDGHHNEKIVRIGSSEWISMRIIK